MSKELMQKNIEKAQKEIDRKRKEVAAGKMRQRYHFMAETGWINDPNGLIEYKGKYHYFYQYNPYNGFWDNMHWGHAVSEDLLHWEFLPLALAPSEPYDNHKQGGCFSGSAVEHDGKLYLVYTGTCNRGNGFEQSQCIAYSEDGIHFEKYEGNPVITAPEDIPKDFFRDPKVWKHDGKYYIICGASKNHMAQALLYRSEDMLHWEFVNVLAESRGEWGYMWECPDFYQIEDKFVLMFSPMGAGERTCVYMVGDFSYETGKFVYDTCGEIDWGFDYYAPQSFLDSKGRRLIVGWANGWDWMPFWKDWGPTYQEGWCGFYNLPREVKLNPDHTLRFEPVEELKALRMDGYQQTDLLLEDMKMEIPLKNGVSYELKMDVDLTETTANRFSFLLRADEQRQTEVTFDLKRQEMCVSREKADGWSRGTTKSPLKMKDKENLSIHIYVDQSSIEVFAENYKTNHSCNVFAEAGQNRNYISVSGGRLKIRSLWTWAMKRVMGCEET